MQSPTAEMRGPNHPISKMANTLSAEAFRLAAAAGVSRFDVCVALMPVQLRGDAPPPAPRS
jgi:hypothetical protein